MCILAAYDENQKMLSCVTVTDDLDDTETISLSLDYESDSTAVEARAFLLDPDSMIPINSVWRHKL